MFTSVNILFSDNSHDKVHHRTIFTLLLHDCPAMNSFSPNDVHHLMKQFLRNTSIYHVTSTLAFVEFTFYNFRSETVLHQKSQKEMNVNKRHEFNVIIGV